MDSWCAPFFFEWPPGAVVATAMGRRWPDVRWTWLRLSASEAVDGEVLRKNPGDMNIMT